MSENKKTLRQSSRPMGTIYPKKIQKVLHGEDVKKIKVYKTGVNENAFITRKVGDTWIDKDGYKWEQLAGNCVMKHPKIGNLGMPWFCPECGRIMKGKADEKMWMLHQKCLKCVVAFEHKLRIEGKWEEYEKKKIIENKLAFLKETLKQAEDHVNITLKKKIDFHNEDGRTETWDNGNYKFEKEFVLKQIEEIKELINKMELVRSGELTEEEAFTNGDTNVNEVQS